VLAALRGGGLRSAARPVTSAERREQSRRQRTTVTFVSGVVISNIDDDSLEMPARPDGQSSA